ncbi:MAG TPA: TatD family hydrolase [Syntrophomonadaceae bacterium]|nr:TatD family hydrolase [Syntrophomonadaceae bacterium]
MLIDTHAHLQDKAFKDDLDEVLKRAKEAEVDKIVCVAYDFESSQKAVELANKYEHIYAVIGVHPHAAKRYTSEMGAQLFDLAKDPKVVAIGEMGLDYYRDLSPRDQQAKAFKEQIKLAQELYKPIVIHDRDAHQDVLDIIKKEKAGKNEGIMHCYSGHVPLAIELMKQGFYISLAGPLTFKNAKKTHEVAAKITLDKIVIETDCPYLTPEPHRGKRNEPAYVREVAKKLAELRGKSIEEIGYITSLNAKKVFRIND